MAKHTSPYVGMFTAGNDHYHGMRSVNEFGAIAHAGKLAQVYLREGKASTEEEAVLLANKEVQRLRWNVEGFQAHRVARDELREELKQIPDLSGPLTA